MRIGIFGAGRLGSLVAAAVRADDSLELAWVVGRDPAPGPVDVAVDVSHADAVADHLAWARRTGTDLVLGCTGWDPDLLRGPTGGTGVLVAPNLSLTVALVRRLARVLGGYAAVAGGTVDLAVSETHHRGKVDAPSGTGLSLQQALAAGSGRAPEDVATTSLRLGAVVGRHSLHYESAEESLVLTHEAHTRDVFAHGALAAARWVHGRPGVHDLDDWARAHLDHLFEAAGTPHAATL